MIDIDNIISKYTDKNIILALSWGPDSIFLFELLKKSKYKDKMIACHLNHMVRDEAQEDEDFVRNLCEKNKVKFISKKIDIKKEMQEWPSVSFEEIARNKRYEFLRECKKENNAEAIILWHHMDDRIETFFLNLSRGSKLSGLINMQEKSWDIIRPLLNLEKSEIIKYLDKMWIEYKIDKTNFDNNITRNFLRNEVIPNFFRINSRFKNNISTTLDYFSDLKTEIDKQVIEKIKDTYFEINTFNGSSELIQNEIIRYVYFITNWNSTIWLSASNIKEVKKFINWKNNKTKKQIKKMALFKDWNKIFFSSK